MSARTAKHSSATAAHYTPAYIVEAARATLGNIDLDPFSDAFGNRIVRAARYFGGDPDGFQTSWTGRVFCNPPGGALPSPLHGTKSSQAAAWCWAAEQWASRAVSAVLFIGFSLEILQAAQLSGALVQPLDFPCCVPSRRLRFDVRARDRQNTLRAELDSITTGPARAGVIERELTELAGPAERDDRWPGDQPTHGNLLVLLPAGDGDVERFRSTFSDVGYTLIPSEWRT
jgi:hypothetical protein